MDHDHRRRRCFANQKHHRLGTYQRFLGVFVRDDRKRRVAVRRPSPLVLALLVVVFVVYSPATAAAVDDACEFDLVVNRLVCEVAGVIGIPGEIGPDADDPGLRYVYTRTDPVIGDCYFWSNLVGGLDSWNPDNEATIIPITTTLPECPAAPNVDPVLRAWEVFRAWELDPPVPTVTPPTSGITGIPTHVAAEPPPVVAHSEILPDGRPLDVRALITELTVGWGDATISSHDPTAATGYPDGLTTHTYVLRTCDAVYRATHPSAELCHPTLDAYTITATYVWSGEYNTGSGWTPLGTLNRTTSVAYEVHEARGTVHAGNS
jgi:hypothetical protein